MYYYYLFSSVTVFKEEKCLVRLLVFLYRMWAMYRGADRSLARPTSRCISFDAENISFDTSLVLYTDSINISPIMIINRIYEHQNLLSL